MYVIFSKNIKNGLNPSVLKQVLVPSLMINILSLALPLTILQIYDRILPNQSYGTAAILLTGAFIALSTEAFLRFVRSWLLAASAANTERDSFKEILSRLNSADANHITKLGPGALHEGIQGVSLVKDYYSGGLLSGIIDVPFVIIFLGLVYYVGGSLVLIPIAVWALAGLIVWLATMTAKTHASNASRLDGLRSGFLVRTLGMLEAIKRQANESFILSSFKRVDHRKAISSAEAEQRTAVAQETIQVASMATSVVIVLVGALVVLSGDMTTGGLAACSILSGRAVQPLSALIGLRMRYDTFDVANRAVDTLKKLPEHAYFTGTSDIGAPLKELKLKNASFQHKGTSFHMNATAKPGDVINIESENSFISSQGLGVISGLVPILSGDFTWNNSPLSQYKYQSYRDHCHYLPQRPVLLNGSILENLCGFDPDITERALSFGGALNLDSIIAELPEGLETKVGATLESPLSAGAIRLVNLTSLFARSKRIIVIDCPEKFLDNTSVAALAKLMSFLATKGAIIFMATDHPSFDEIITRRIKVSAEEEVDTHAA